MPKAKLTTRTLTTTSVTADSIPKNAGITANELDSNFINLRDQSWTIRADDSTLHQVPAGTQVNFDGATITAASNGDIVVDIGGGTIGDLSIVGSSIIAPSNGNLRLTTSGTGNVVVQDTFLYVSQLSSGGPDNEGQGEIMRVGYDSGNKIDFNHNGNGGGTFSVYGTAGQTSSGMVPLQVTMSGTHEGTVITLAPYDSGSMPTGHAGKMVAVENQSHKPAYHDGSVWRYVHDNSTV